MVPMQATAHPPGSRASKTPAVQIPTAASLNLCIARVGTVTHVSKLEIEVRQ